MSALNLGRVGTPIPQKIWDVFLFASPLISAKSALAQFPTVSCANLRRLAKMTSLLPPSIGSQLSGAALK